MRALTNILIVIVVFACISRAEIMMCSDSIFGDAEDGETVYAACHITHDGYKYAICTNGTYSIPDESYCTERTISLFSYGIDSVYYKIGEEIPILAISSDGAVDHFVCVPILPAGLHIHENNGTIYGIPEESVSATYVISANGENGPKVELTIVVSGDLCPALDSFPITVNGETAESTTACPDGYRGTATRLCSGGFFGDLNTAGCTLKGPANLFYVPSSVSVKRLQSITAMIPSVENTVVSYSSNPILPDGLVLSTKGTISGVPTTVQQSTAYVITVTGENGQTTQFTIAITVLPASCSGIQNDQGIDVTMEHNSQLSSSSWCPEFTTGTASYSCIDGVYTSLSTLGCMTKKPTSFTYARSSFDIYAGDYINTGNPSYVGKVVKFDVDSVPLLEGLTLDAATGVLSGIPLTTGLNQIIIQIYARPEMTSLNSNSAKTSIIINMKVAQCEAIGAFKTVNVGSTAIYKCENTEGYEGEMKRKCMKNGNRAMWEAPEGYCQKKQDFIFLYISIGIFVICLIVLIVGISVKSSRSRSKKVKSLKSTKTSTKIASNKIHTVKAPTVAPKPKSVKVAI